MNRIASLTLLIAAVALTVHAGDDQAVYSDFWKLSYGTLTFNNGWQDNGWGPRYRTNSPVHSGTNSYCLAPNGGWQAIKLVHGDIDTSLYTNLTLWVNGGSVGGQTVGVSASIGGVEQSRQAIGINGKLPTNSWVKVVLPLTSMGAANKTNLDGFYIWNNTGATQPAFYLDDITLVAASPPATIQVSVNATQTVRTVDSRLFGVNAVAWDGDLDTSSTLSLLTNMDNQVLRWPGGSWGDGYHWTNENRGWGSYSWNFMHVATNTHAQAFIIVNYGSSSPEEAAYGVRMFNVTNRCGFKYWEVGNEVGGSWETDNNTNAPWQPHDPWTYAMRFKDYYTQMKAVDPSIKIGAVADITEDGTANYTNHPALNPRTGKTHNGWTPVMLATMKTNGVVPDFLIEHKYAPNGGDMGNLLWCKTWASDAASLRQMLADYLGSAGTNVELTCTEHGAGGDKQRVSLVGGLFWADSVGQILQTEFNTLLWWDMRNGQGSVTNSDDALYGWRTNSSGYFYYDEGIVTGSAVGADRYPTFYCAKLLKYFARGGDAVVKAASDSLWLGAYAVRRTNGNLTVLLVNKSADDPVTARLTLNGYRPATNLTVYSYGIPQDAAARTGVGSMDVVTTNFATAGTNFTYTCPPYSASVLTLVPGPNPPPAPTNLVAIAADGKVLLSWAPVVGATSYRVKSTTLSGVAYTTVGSPSETNFTDTLVVNGTKYYYVALAVSSAGTSTNSLEVSATPQPAPQLSLSPAADKVALSWPGWAAGYNLYATTNLAPGTVWWRENCAVLSNGGVFQVQIPTTNSARFYRLQAP